MDNDAGLAVRRGGRGWGVFHDSGREAATSLRQRRFAEEARAELLATGVDFTADAGSVGRARAQWAEVYFKWRARSQATCFDNATGEYYAQHVSYGTFVPSANWAAAYREACAGSDGATLERLVHDGNKAVR